MNKKGFTLIELLVTLLVISIIATITIPIVSNVIERSRKKTYIASMKEIIKIADEYYADNGYINKECVSINSLDYNKKDKNLTGNVCYQDGIVVLDEVKNDRFEANGSLGNIVITILKTGVTSTE